MNPITQLDQHLINKIAAGEVVERPLSVVKELIENAIDAGATSITVEIVDGGLTKIRVTDNGSGIPADQLQLAFARHATSKITSIDDLFLVQTLGFRGEALSSIAAVAQVEMITKTSHAMTGRVVEIHGGVVMTARDIGCANGTTVVVANLFFNTPARRKFLKKPATEASYISDCLERLALANPTLTLRYINNGKVVFQSGGNGDLKTTMLNIYGREVATKVLAIDACIDELHLYGLVGKPEIARSNRSHGSFFINGRYIQSRLLNSAVEAAMSGLLPSGKFPLFALNLRLPFDALDVNVHPTKMDVRFADEEGVFAFVEDAVREGLSEYNLVPVVRRGREKNAEKTTPEEAKQLTLPSLDQPNRRHVELHQASLESESYARSSFELDVDIESAIRDLYINPSKSISAKEKSDIGSYTHPVQREVPSATYLHDSNLLPQENLASIIPERIQNFFSNYQIHTLIFNTYWLVTQNNSLYLIDQHAAHERVLYENLLAKAQSQTLSSQQLLIPIPLRLTLREKQTLTDNVEHFHNFGFGIDTDENDDSTITAVPLLLNGPLSTGFFADILDKIDEVGFSKDGLYNHKTEIIAMASCKAAVKGGDGLTEAEARALIGQLLALKNPFTCPHGRPTIVEIAKTELERRFKRS